jgi:hypothetical protein
MAATPPRIGQAEKPQAVRTAEAVAQELAGQLDASRLEMFGRYYAELEARMKEFSQSVDSGLARSRQVVSERIEELGAALHRDMITFRQEHQREMEDLKRDVFTAVMSLSAVNDRISAVESRAAEQLHLLQEGLVALSQRTAALAQR